MFLPEEWTTVTRREIRTRRCEGDTASCAHSGYRQGGNASSPGAAHLPASVYARSVRLRACTSAMHRSARRGQRTRRGGLAVRAVGARCWHIQCGNAPLSAMISRPERYTFSDLPFQISLWGSVSPGRGAASRAWGCGAPARRKPPHTIIMIVVVIGITFSVYVCIMCNTYVYNTIYIYIYIYIHTHMWCYIPLVYM